MIESMETEKTAQNITVRYPPSPTGLLHIGNVRTFIFNYLFAKKNGGKIILRFEDTDRERSKKEYEKNILDALSWLGLTFDEGPYRQTERAAVYRTYLEKMLTDGSAYISQESPEEGEGELTGAQKRTDRRSEVIRLKNQNKKITFHDLIRGDITFDTTELGDIVIAKSVDEAIYHFAVVVDDHEMGITHVIRGEDHISNTPRQILIQEAIGAVMPQYAHLPLILASDRSKLGKRHGAVAVTEYRSMGYLPEGLLNYLVLLGWNPGHDHEIFFLEEAAAAFDIAKVQKAGAVFSEEKLRWVNKEHLARLPREKRQKEIKEHLASRFSEEQLSPEAIAALEPLIMERVSTWGDVSRLGQAGEYDWYFSDPAEYDANALHWKSIADPANTKKHLAFIRDTLASVPDNAFSEAAVKNCIFDYATKEGRGDALWPLRYALSGREKSPDPFVLAAILGKQTTLRRIQTAIEKLDS